MWKDNLSLLPLFGNNFLPYVLESGPFLPHDGHVLCYVYKYSQDEDICFGTQFPYFA